MPSVITGRTKAQEIRIQDRLMTTTAARFERAYRNEILRAMRELGRSNANESLIMQRHTRELMNIVTRNYTAAATSFGQRILRSAQKSFLRNISTKEGINPTDVFDASMISFINSFGARRVSEIAGTTQEQAQSIINAEIEQGVIDGNNEMETSRAIVAAMNAKAPVLSAYRSRVIARTETATAANTATHEAGLATGLPLKKEWATAIDGRERDTHKRANGQRVGMNGTFSVGRDELRHPSDPRGSAKEVINCRCVELLMVDL